MHTARKWKLQLVREANIRYDSLLVSSSVVAAKVLWEELKYEPREHFVVLMLNTKNRIVGYHTVSMGDHRSSLITPVQLFAPLFLANSTICILGHNHPSGDTQPSEEDRQVTGKLVTAADMLKIRVLDHIIVGTGTNHITYYSFADNDALKEHTCSAL
jgi:DNA repair protein RadC